MTPEEVEKFLNQIIKIKKPGLVCGWGYEQIVDYDFFEKSPNGKGTVTMQNPFDRKKYKRKFAISQIELYEGNGNSRKRKRNNNSRKRKRSK